MLKETNLVHLPALQKSILDWGQRIDTVEVDRDMRGIQSRGVSKELTEIGRVVIQQFPVFLQCLHTPFELQALMIPS